MAPPRRASTANRHGPARSAAAGDRCAHRPPTAGDRDVAGKPPAGTRRSAPRGGQEPSGIQTRRRAASEQRRPRGRAGAHRAPGPRTANVRCHCDCGESGLNWVGDDGDRRLEGRLETARPSRAARLPYRSERSRMTSTKRHRTETATARAKSEMQRADRDRRIAQIITARHELATDRRVGGRAWLKGRAVGGTDPRYMHLEAWHD